jgi:hypothetical protein
MTLVCVPSSATAEQRIDVRERHDLAFLTPTELLTVGCDVEGTATQGVRVDCAQLGTVKPRMMAACVG